MPTTGGLAIWLGCEYMLSFPFAIRLQFQPASKAEQQNKQETFNYKFSSGYGLTIFKHRYIAKPYRSKQRNISITRSNKFRLKTKFLFYSTCFTKCDQPHSTATRSGAGTARGTAGWHRRLFIFNRYAVSGMPSSNTLPVAVITPCQHQKFSLQLVSIPSNHQFFFSRCLNPSCSIAYHTYVHLRRACTPIISGGRKYHTGKKERFCHCPPSIGPVHL